MLDLAQLNLAQLNLVPLSQLELRQLCYFLTIVANGNNFSRAAEQLHIEQAPLSQRIRALEKRLNVELFDRRHRPVQLTPAGDVFRHHLQSSLAQLQQAIEQAQRTARGELGVLRLGMASSVANSILPDILRQFRDRYPFVTLELHELTAQQQIQALHDRQLDIALEAFPPLADSDTNWKQQVIAQESLVLALPIDHPLATQAQIPLRAIAQEPIILPSLSAFPFYHAFITACIDAGFQPQVVQTTTATWLLTILGMVVAGMGIAVLPSNVLTVQRQGILYREIADLTLTREISALWNADHGSIVLDNFLAILLQ
ncbi:LysR family transcriptional regulator [Alkalinema sp. FACHB-956]|uniref:LysR family transcriptional regulator n=1 Tax=Alkalinema sp. FACHB-956 TaxID=2692768 RepID=UPI0016894DC6|nr:LysR family transcriptional regulator [Alkalinema sp. FACHB-956]MBD2326472.1 LysR family transcriptional regulator [Alkalinema sp. FACHB-956]